MQALGRKIASAFAGNAAVDTSKGTWKEFWMNALSNSTADAVEIIAFMLHDQQFCVRTKSILEIRGWAPVTPLPDLFSSILKRSSSVAIRSNGMKQPDG